MLSLNRARSINDYIVKNYQLLPLGHEARLLPSSGHVGSREAIRESSLSCSGWVEITLSRLAWEELYGMCIQRTIPRDHDDWDAECLLVSWFVRDSGR